MPDPKIADELRKMAREPILPIEKKLVVYSLLLGVLLLAILMWVNHAIFG